MVWVFADGKTSDAVMDVAACKAACVRNGKAKFCLDGAEVWQTAEQLGWAADAAAQITTPKAPAVPTAPQAPATSPAEAAPNGMTPEEAAEYDQLTAALAVPGVVPQMDQVTRLMALEQKKSGK